MPTEAAEVRSGQEPLVRQSGSKGLGIHQGPLAVDAVLTDQGVDQLVGRPLPGQFLGQECPSLVG